MKLIFSESSAASNPGEISTRDLLNIFSQTNLGTSRDPITYYGRKELQNFLNHRLSSFVATVISSGKAGGDERNQYLQQPFQTKVRITYPYTITISIEKIFENVFLFTKK